jgi:hypothetical protein
MKIVKFLSLVRLTDELTAVLEKKNLWNGASVLPARDLHSQTRTPLHTTVVQLKIMKLRAQSNE